MSAWQGWGKQCVVRAAAVASSPRHHAGECLQRGEPFIPSSRWESVGTSASFTRVRCVFPRERAMEEEKSQVEGPVVKEGLACFSFSSFTIIVALSSGTNGTVRVWGSVHVAGTPAAWFDHQHS